MIGCPVVFLRELSGGRDQTRGSNQEVVIHSRVEPGWVTMCSNLMGRVGSDKEIFRYHGLGRVYPDPMRPNLRKLT